MTYRQIFQRFLYAAFACGLCVELAAIKLCTDAAGCVHRGGLRLQASGQAQLQALPGGEG